MNSKKIKKIICDSINNLNATIIYFDYNAKFFGNIVVKIKDCNGSIHEYVLDRGTVYVGSVFVCQCNKEYREKIKVLINCIISDLQQ